MSAPKRRPEADGSDEPKPRRRAPRTAASAAQPALDPSEPAATGDTLPPDAEAGNTKARDAAARGGRASAARRKAAAPGEAATGAEGGGGSGRPERPDEFSAETFEFIAAVDEFKRRRMRGHLTTADVVAVLTGLGYRGPGRGAEAVARADDALLAYKRQHGRLFPGWSEVFAVLVALGYRRAA